MPPNQWHTPAKRSMIRRRNASSPWQTPLPVTTPKKRNTSTESAVAARMMLITCSSLICIIVFCGVIFSATFSSSSFPARTHKLLHKNKHISRMLKRKGFQDESGKHSITRQEKRHANNIEYANLQDSHQYDVIVVGCGPAGLTAALFASRMGMSVLVIGSPSSGALSGTAAIDNFPSYFGTGASGGGQGWVDATLEQAAYFGTQFASPTLLATGFVKRKVDEFEVYLSMMDAPISSNTKKVLGQTVIIASGSTPRKLNLPHETSLWGRSLHNCALCDGDLYVRNPDAKKSVAVIGGGDAAVEAIFLLHKLGVHAIHWIHRRDEYRASALEVERVRQLPNVEIWTPYVVTEWMAKEERGDATGTDEDSNSAPLTLEGIRIVGAKNGVADTESASSLTIPCDGAFLMIGSTPNSKWLQSSGVDIDPDSELIHLVSSVDSNVAINQTPQFSTSTSMQGIFAAGEVVDGAYRQALTASSDGAKAAIDAQRYMRHMGTEASVLKQNSPSEKGRQQQRKMTEINESMQKNTGSDCDLTKPECIQQIVSTHPVVVFSKSYCPYCHRALEAIRTFTEPKVIDLTEVEDMRGAQNALTKITGRRTVPNVFVGGVSIGGGEETTKLHQEGKLEDLLRKAGAVQ